MRFCLGVTFTVVSLIAAVPGRAASLTSGDIASALAFAEQQAVNTMSALGNDPTLYPRSAPSGSPWTSIVGASDWTSGFWPTELTSLYRATGNQFWLTNAINWTQSLTGQAAYAFDADIGMRMQSVGALYSLTGDPSYKAVLLQAAGSLAQRFNTLVPAINQWDFTGPNTFNLVLDGMNDLRPLYWGAANGGDPAWLTMAEEHADTVNGTLVRSDGSTYQYATYDPGTGQQTFLGTYQGYSNTSDWQRGLTWAINGYSDLYYQTKNANYLAVAEKLADHFINVLPQDCVPVWDPGDPAGSNAPRDTSAGALGDLGLTKLSVLATNGNNQSYAAAAQCGLSSLINNGYLAPSSSDAVLQHGNAPDGPDVSLIYGDAAFVTALTAWQDLNAGIPIDWTMSYDVSELPEPTSLVLLGVACAGVFGVRRRRSGN